jgi:hypothetical protein
MTTLTGLLSKCHKKDVLLFVDNYDTPIMDEHQSFNSSCNWREATQMVRTFVTALECAEHVGLLLIFGNHRFHVSSSKLYVYGVDMDRQTQQEGLIRFFGFSNNEFDELCGSYKFEMKDEAKRYYNGEILKNIQIIEIQIIHQIGNLIKFKFYKIFEFKCLKNDFL